MEKYCVYLWLLDSLVDLFVKCSRFRILGPIKDFPQERRSQWEVCQESYRARILNLCPLQSLSYPLRWIFFNIYLLSQGQGRFPSLYPEFFYIITQWSCSASGSLGELPDSIPEPLPQKSGVLPMSHQISQWESWSWSWSPNLIDSLLSFPSQLVHCYRVPHKPLTLTMIIPLLTSCVHTSVTPPPKKLSLSCVSAS